MGQVSGGDGFRHDAGIGSERGRFGSHFGPTRVSARDGFRIATSFGPTRVSALDKFRVGTDFVSVWSVFSVFIFYFVLIGFFGFVSDQFQFF
ncbi:hypothetical protein HanRHA438_Chr06g0269291 [Helianthus annuus]|nr:hypothetical protein HanRHA438_Chr06g0269291 [Helianthus annuus]